MRAVARAKVRVQAKRRRRAQAATEDAGREAALVAGQGPQCIPPRRLALQRGVGGNQGMRQRQTAHSKASGAAAESQEERGSQAGVARNSLRLAGDWCGRRRWKGRAERGLTAQGGAGGPGICVSSEEGILSGQRKKEPNGGQPLPTPAQATTTQP